MEARFSSAFLPPARTAERENAQTGGRAEPCRLRDDLPAEEGIMKKSFRSIVSILVIAGVLLVSAVPAMAAPRMDSFSESAVPGLRLVAELWDWASAWIGEPPIESVWSSGRVTIDPDGEPAIAPGPDSASGDTESSGDAGASGPGV